MTVAPRWRKAVRDVFARRGRAFLVVVAMAAGVFEIGTMLYTYALLRPVLSDVYGTTHPSSATLYTDDASDATVAIVAHVPGVAVAEARPVVVARVHTGPGEFVPAVLYVVRDFDHQRLDTFVPDGGAWPPADGAVLLERTALRVAGVSRNDTLPVRLAGGDERSLLVSGTVHAAGLPPAWMEHMVPGFVGWNSSLRGAGESAQIRFAVAEDPLDEGHIREVAAAARAALERGGHVVTRVNVPTPGRHPHADQMEAFLYLVLAFGVLSFLLSAVLVAAMVQALMAEQIRQVGMMKAIGATDRQIAGLYLGQVSMLAAAALCVGVPLALLAGRAYAEFSGGILNVDVTGSPFPVWVVVAEVVGGVLVPLAFALGPVLRASRITVHEALGDDPGPLPFGARRGDRWLTGLAWLPRPLALSLRTAVARRGRLALTIGMLAVGGAVFMAALNLSGAWVRAVDADFAARRYDLSVGLASPVSIDSLQALLDGVPGVVRAESWPGLAPYLVGRAGTPGNAVALLGVPPGSTLTTASMLAGRWLRPDERDGAVINRAVQIANPGLGVGDSVRMRLEGRTIAFPVIGVMRELAPMPVVYAPRPAMLAATGRPESTTRALRIVTRGHDDAAQRAAGRAIEDALAGRGIEVSMLQRMQEARKGILDHLVIIMSILTFAALIVVFVGGLGLASTMALNVVQRTREIGILGAIGATPATIARHVWFESVLIGVASWGVANLLAAPASAALEAACGQIFFKIPLDFYMSPGASATWLALVVVIASIGSIQPARRAARLTVREALAHA